MKELLEAGVHIGHRIQRWNPKMKPFLYGTKEGVHIIDIIKTVRYLRRACQFLQSAGTLNKSLLFVGTKNTASDIIPLAAKECSGFYIKQRWLGGFLTNWPTMRKCIQKLELLDQDLGTEEISIGSKIQPTETMVSPINQGYTEIFGKEEYSRNSTTTNFNKETFEGENTNFKGNKESSNFLKPKTGSLSMETYLNSNASESTNTMAIWSNGDSQAPESRSLEEVTSTSNKANSENWLHQQSQLSKFAGGSPQNVNVSSSSITNSHSQIRKSLTKKELLSLKKQQMRLTKFFGGVRGMTERPDVVVIIGQNEEKNAVYESIKLKIANVTLIDTDCDPELADYPIPANDDSSQSISVILQKLVQAYKMPII